MDSFCIWLLSLNITLVRTKLVIPCTCNLSVFIALYYSIVSVYHNVFIHPKDDGHWCCPQFGAVMKMLLSTFLYVSLVHVGTHFSWVYTWEQNCWS